MKTLSSAQLLHVSGGEIIQVEEFIPESISGLELIGWQQEIVGWDSTKWEVHGWFSTSYYEEKTPIYSFTPIYA